MNRLLETWRYYSFGRDQYQECINKVFITNLSTLRQANTIVAIFAGVFSLFPILIQKNFFFACFYLATAVVALVLSMYMNYKIQTSIVNNRFIYIFTTIFYVNVMALGIFLGVWATPDKLATIYLCFLICALLMFINPPWFNLCLTLASMIFFMVFTLIFKTTENAIYDIVDTVIAGVIGLYFGWQISKLRMGLEISTTMLEEERNKYLDQSTVDELTKLKNRRDFMQTFQRYLSNYRTSDDWLCVSISDIDFFKFYNDHYGHPKGDECLRSIGAAFNKLRDDKNVYVARIGGEEFGMLWFEKEMSHADTVVKYMAELVKELKIPHEKSKIAEHVTMSMGVYIERCGASTDVKALYDLADKALYAAKEGGRNCIIITGRETEQYKITPEQ